MTKAMVTGSFDPVTLGHVDVIRRALERYDEVCVGMLVNPEKEYAYPAGERLAMLKEVLDPLGVEVYYSEGLAVDLAKKVGASVMVRGVRPGDEAYEAELARLNMEIGAVPTEFIEAGKEYREVSSTLVKERLAQGKDVRGLVPEQIIKRL